MNFLENISKNKLNLKNVKNGKFMHGWSYFTYYYCFLK